MESFNEEMDNLDAQPLKARLLIVDDEPHIRSSVARALTLLGYSVDEAGSGEEALARLRQTSFDLMVLDMHMPPGPDGVEVMKQARQIQPELLIIVLTGHATLENAIASVKLHADDYLQKPVKTKQIAHVVTRALQKRARRLAKQQLLEFLDKTLDALRQSEILASLDASALSSESDFSPHSNQFIHVAPLILNREKRWVMYEDNSAQPIGLTKGETAVLATLMSHANRVLSSQKLVELGWGDLVDAEESKAIIRPHIYRLRRKIEIDPATPKLICTVRRRGYRFVPQENSSNSSIPSS